VCLCVDYTNHNKVCPKDAYPLPSLDRLVETLSSTTLSFLDTFLGYNQIPMVEDDKMKIAFITEETNYYYEVMPIGLKNARATYERLMDRVFNHLIEKNVKVYVDDMAVKSPTSAQHSQDLSQVFSALRAYNLRLNMYKCMFEVDGTSFLDLCWHIGLLKPTQKKCEVVIEMKSPKYMKEVQRLIVRLTTIS